MSRVAYAQAIYRDQRLLIAAQLLSAVIIADRGKVEDHPVLAIKLTDQLIARHLETLPPSLLTSRRSSRSGG